MYYQAVMSRMYYYHGLAQAPEPAISRITNNGTDCKVEQTVKWNRL